MRTKYEPKSKRLRNHIVHKSAGLLNEVPTETTVTEADVSKMQANQSPASNFQEAKDIISPYSQPAPLKKRKVSFSSELFPRDRCISSNS